MIPKLLDSTLGQPRLRCDISFLNLVDLPDFSTGPRGEPAEKLAAIRAAGYEGVQAADPKQARQAGLRATAMATIYERGKLGPLCREFEDQGVDCVTVHVGTGMESADEAARLIEDVLRASQQSGLPVFVETHRATLTQDMWRTVEIVKQFPEIRFNIDLSHWYCGLEMTYGDWAAKMEFLQPIFDRTKFMHGRIANSSCMQVDVGDGTSGQHVEHFRDMWTRSFAGFLRHAQPGEYMIFAPELLFPSINYARTFRNDRGELVEETDRWEQAKVLVRIARECFAAAERRNADIQEHGGHGSEAT